ncbi:GIY-YIG nuclease family protein [Rubritalea marina]|uniref:GIY-YIG nuclease family protein n=1 Tax=Rubritalea marina TaxID=361055 RepID=UPI003CCCF41D
MAFVYILKGQSGRHYIGSTEDLDARITRHNSGMVHSTKRLGLPVVLIAAKHIASMSEARKLEATLKRWKNPKRVIQYITSS